MINKMKLEQSKAKLELKRRHKRVARMLAHWAEVIVYREDGGTGYPSCQGDGKGGAGSGLSRVAEDFLVIEEALTRLKLGAKGRIRRRIYAEFVAKAKDRPWTFDGWAEDVLPEEKRWLVARRLNGEYLLWRKRMAYELVDAEDVAGRMA